MPRKIEVALVGDPASIERMFARGSKAGKGFEASIRGSTKSLLAVAGAGTSFVALGKGIESAVSSSARFADAMQKIVGLSGVAQGRVDQFNKQVLQLAPAVGKGPQELADALFFITSSGISASKAMGVLTESAKASAAGLGETQVVADAVTSAMNAYGVANLSAKQATDVLVATVREGKGEADQFAGVIGNVAALAAQLGVSFNDVGAALAAETRIGTDAETAAVQLQRVFSSLVKVTPQSEKAFRSVGLSAAGLREELGSQGLLATLKTIQTAFGGAKLDLPALTKAFGDVRAVRGVLALVGKQADQVAVIFQHMADVSGSSAKAFGAVAGDSQQQFERLGAAAKVLQIEIGAALAPAFESAATSLTKWLSQADHQAEVQRIASKAAQDLTKAMKAAEGAFVAIEGPTETVVHALGGLKDTLELLAAVKIATKLSGLGGGFTRMGGNARSASGDVKGLSGALAKLPTTLKIGITVAIAFEVAKGGHALDKFLHERFPGVFGRDVSSIKLADIRAMVKEASNRQALEELEKKVKALGALGAPKDVIAAAEKAIDRKLDQFTSHSGGAGASQRVKDRPDSASPSKKPPAPPAPKPPSPPPGGSGSGTPKFVTAFRKELSGLQVQLGRAGFTDTLKDDIKVEERIVGFVNREAKLHGHTLEILQAQVEEQGKLLSLQKQQQDAIRQQVDAARGQLTGLFGGPILSGPFAQFASQFGAKPSASLVLKDLQASNKVDATFIRDIATITRRGGSKQFLSDLESGGIANAPFAHAIATASKSTFGQFMAAFAVRERQARELARMEVKAQNVVISADRVVLTTSERRNDRADTSAAAMSFVLKVTGHR